MSREDLVLVVEDDADVRESLVTAVEEAGCASIAAADGRAALALLEAAVLLPKLVVLDLNMPVMDGVTFARAVRSDPRLADLPIVVMSGDPQAERRIADLDAAAVLRKPIDVHAFRRVVQRHAGGGGNPRASKPLVLLVEDDVDVRELTAEYLRDCDFEVTLAEDGARAVELAVALAPDVVVMDLGLPGVTGEDAIRRLKADAATEAIPIVVLSGYTQPAQRKRIIDDLGCAAFLGKPSSPPDLILAIEQTLAELRS